MRAWSGIQLLDIARERRALAAGELKAVKKDIADAERDIKKLDAAVDEAWADLAAAVVPSLDGAWLDARASQLHLPWIAQEHVKQQHEEYVRAQQAVVAAVDADPRAAPGADNAIAIKLAEVDDAIRPLHDSVTTLESEPYFAELIRTNYDTDAYVGRFWQLSYYRHWKNADIIVAKHGTRMRVTRFAELRDKYKEEQAALGSLIGEKRRLERARNEVAGLLQKRDAAARAVENAAARTLGVVRSKVQSHLRPVALDAVAQLFPGEEGVEFRLKRIAGVQKKRDYARAMMEHFLLSTRDNLSRVVQKASRAETKYGRAKNARRTFQVDVDRAFPDKRDAWRKRRDRFSFGMRRLSAFDDWSRGSLAGDFLWWDVFMDGSLDGRFIPEVGSAGASSKAHAAVAARQQALLDDQALELDVS